MADIRVKSYTEILTNLCDWFDEMISPKKIQRKTTNIIYLIFSAIAKGYEVINNICVSLQSKFLPLYCSADDLASIAAMVGTTRLQGSYSGLSISATNNNETSITLPAGTYSYALDDATSFYFTLAVAQTVSASGHYDFIALTNKVGEFAVDAQASINVECTATLPDGITFSCTGNAGLLGAPIESDVDFRNRLANTTDRVNTLEAMKEEIQNLPYVFDCQIVFNNSASAITYEGISIAPYYMLLVISGELKAEIASIVAKYGIYPTVATTGVSTELRYASSVFSAGYYPVNVHSFGTYTYNITITYHIDTSVTLATVAESTMRGAILSALNVNKHIDYIREKDVYDAIATTDIPSLITLNTDLSVNGSAVSYVSVPKNKIATIGTITFVEA